MWPWDGSAAFGEASSSTSAVEDLSWDHDHASWTDRGYGAATPNRGTRSLAPFPPYLIAALASVLPQSVAEIVFTPEYLARQGYGYASYNPDGGHMAEGAAYQHADDLYAPPWSGADHDLYRRLSESCDSGSVFPFSMGVSIVIVVVLVMMSGLFSGLTLGLMGLDITGLDIIAHSDDKKAAANARKIIPVRKSGNFLLCTLLLGNVAVNSMLSIVMADLTSGTTGFIVSTAVIVVFGEILPQASCSRYALQIGAATAWIVRILQFLLGILAWPLSYALDIILGDEMGTIHSKQELRRLLQIHVQQGALKKEEGDVVAGALKFRNKPLSKVMTQKEDCFMLNQNEVLDYATLLEISNSGFSRIPVYNKTDSDIVGVLVTKDLIFVDPEDAMPLRQFLKVFGRHVERFYADDTCGDALHRFKLGRAHLGLVVKKVRKRVSDPRHKAPPQGDHVSDHGSESASGGAASIENATGLVNANSSAGGDKGEKDPAGAAQSGTNKQPSHPKKDSHHSSATNSSGQTQDHAHVRIQCEQEQVTQFVLQGIVTLEDVIEEILQDEIVDETDVFIDMHNKEERDFVESEEAVLPPEEPRNSNKLNNSMGSSNRGGGDSFDDVDHTSSKGSDWHGDDRSDFGGAKPSPLSGPSDSFVGKPLLEATAQALLSPMAVAGAMVGAVAGTMESERSGSEPTGRNVRPMGDASEDNILSRQVTNEKEAGGGTAGSGAAGAAGSFQQGGATSSTARAMGSGTSRPGGTPTGGVSGAASGVYPPAGAGGGGSTAGGGPTRTNPGQATGLNPTPGGNLTSNHSGTNYDATEDTYSYTKSDGRFTPGLGHGEDISLMDSVSRLRPVGRQSRRGKRRQREDITRLRFFNPSIRGDALLPQEVDVLVSHLLENYEGPGFDLSASGKEHSTANPVDGSPPEEGDPRPYRTPWLSQRWRNDEERTEGRTKWISRHALNWLLIERGNVEVLYRNAPARCPRPDKEDWIYRRGQEVDFMTIILTGVVMIIVGRDGFQQECGAFSVLGIDALAASSAFAPDFSAALWSDVVTLVRISRDMYEEARALEARDQIPFVEPAVNARIKRATKQAEASEISRGRPHRKVQQRAVSRDHDRERERELFEDVVDDDRSPKDHRDHGKLHGSSSSSARTGGAYKNQQDYLREQRVSDQSASDLFEKDSNYKYQDEYDSPKKTAGGTADRNNRRGDNHNDRKNSKDQVKQKDSFLGIGGGKKEGQGSSILGSFFSAFEPRKRSKLASAAAEVPAQPSRMW